MLARVRASIDQPTLDRLVLLGLVLLAAVLRFVDLPTRGTWDADQGHDMLVLSALVRAGEMPLLGPPTSIGDFHHGALYYYLLAPAAALTGADPLSVVAAIALAGVARGRGHVVAGAVDRRICGGRRSPASSWPFRRARSTSRPSSGTRT